MEKLNCTNKYVNNFIYLFQYSNKNMYNYNKLKKKSVRLSKYISTRKSNPVYLNE